MVSKPVVQVIIAAAALLWGVLLTIQGVAVELAWLRWYSLVVGIVVVVLFAFDRWLWRTRAFRWLVRVPDVTGTWKGELRSSWTDSDTGQQTEPIKAYLVVRQTYSTVSATLITAESKSYSVATNVESLNGDEAILSYTYRNVPKLLLQERSRVHHGTAHLDVHGAQPHSLVGSYWTDRDTKGQMAFRERSKKRYTEFQAAESALG